MLLAVSALLALNLQVQIGPSPRRAPVVRDSSADTSRRGYGRNRGIRRPVTAEDQRTAFKDATAKVTLLHARVARMSQDSALTAYDAMSYQRISAGMGFSKIGRDRSAVPPRERGTSSVAAGCRCMDGREGFSNAHSRWSALKRRGKKSTQEMNDPDMKASIPYFPGYEPLMGRQQHGAGAGRRERRS